MPTFAESLRPSLAVARAIGGDLGLRLHSVTVETGTWAGDETGDSPFTEAETTVLENGQNPQVRWLTDEQIALAATTSAATVQIGPLTPGLAVGGTDLETIAGSALTTGQTLNLKIVGPQHPDGARYLVVDIEAHSALHYMLKAKPS